MSSACVACVQDSQISQIAGSKVNGAIPVASVPDLGSSYIKNTNSQQGSSNFNISGSGTAGETLSGNSVNATTQYNIGGNRVLSIAGTSNLFAGPSAGQANTSGSGNAFVGAGAGQANTVGINNSFFGLSAGSNNAGFISQITGQVTTGKNNSFFGTNAGRLITQGTDNSFFGANAGGSSTQGVSNSFFGSSAGSVSAGDANAFFGVSSGAGNNGSRNSFFGLNAGAVGNHGAPSGDDNAFFGTFAGEKNIASGNSFFGSGAGMSNTEGTKNSFFGFQAGQSATFYNNDSFFGYQAGQNSTSSANSFFGALSGRNNINGFGNSFFGYSTGLTNNYGINNTLIGSGSDVSSPGLTYATAIGADAKVSCDHCLVLGDADDSSLSVGIGIKEPHSKLDVRGANRTGLYATSDAGLAVLATSQNNIAVQGQGYFGVYGYGYVGNGGNGTGFPFSYTGVVGESSGGIGVVAVSDSGNLMAGVSGNGLNHPYVQRFHINNAGTYFTGSDFAEALPACGGKTAFAPGDVLVLSSIIAGAVEKSSRPYDTRAAGIYSTRPGVVGADKNGETRVDPDDLPVAIIGVVPTKVSTENGPIQIGDVLTTSATPGYAMRCDDRLKCLGAIVGKAMEALPEGKRMIKVLVTLK